MAVWTWVLPFVLQAAILGLIMYALVLLADLENDHINPHECARRLNKLVMPERGVLVAQGAVYLLHGRWGMALLNGALLAWQVGFVQPVDVTELFRTLAKEKRARLIRLAVAVAVFVLLLVRLLEHAMLIAVAAPPTKRSGPPIATGSVRPAFERG